MNIFTDIAEVMKQRTCIVGAGNYFKKDDAAGLYILDEVSEKAETPGVVFINAEDVIEAYVFKIAEMDAKNVVIIDAVQSQTSPGSVMFGKLRDMEGVISNYSTHKLSMKLAARILEEHGKEVYLLGIEAKEIDFGSGLSAEVKESADIVKDFLIDTLRCGEKERTYEQ
ncbi:MAG TPA: hydrogenase maturation protease [Spirochaetota bacterium]|nr:hydrogenase maturation protease [Spirochaetota bacterium]